MLTLHSCGFSPARTEGLYLHGASRGQPRSSSSLDANTGLPVSIHCQKMHLLCSTRTIRPFSLSVYLFIVIYFPLISPYPVHTQVLQCINSSALGFCPSFVFIVFTLSPHLLLLLLSPLPPPTYLVLLNPVTVTFDLGLRLHASSSYCCQVTC